MRVGVRGAVRRGAAKTSDDVTEKFRRAGVVRARTWKSPEIGVEIQSRRNVALRRAFFFCLPFFKRMVTFRVRVRVKGKEAETLAENTFDIP